MKIHTVLRAVDHTGELAQCLRHQSGLQTHVAVAHVTLDFALGSECGHGVDHQHIDCRRADKLLGNLQGLLTVVGLRNEEVVDIHAEFLGIKTVEGMLGIDDGSHAPLALCLGYGM